MMWYPCWLTAFIIVSRTSDENPTRHNGDDGDNDDDNLGDGNPEEEATEVAIAQI